jgi:hypothetical protein
MANCDVSVWVGRRSPLMLVIPVETKEFRLATMNNRGSHRSVSPSTLGFVGLRPIESKNVSYLRKNDSLSILYLVQLGRQLVQYLLS